MPLNLENLKLLVVEDNDPMRHIISSILVCLGVKTIFKASDGRSGFEIFQQEKPDMVLTDWEMDIVNGLDLTRKIRKEASSVDRETPIIMVSGYNASSRILQARDSGVNDYLMKPYTAENLSKHISSIINRPLSFVDCETYTGPDRRRRKVGVQSDRRKEESDSSGKSRYVSPPRALQAKTGTGEMDAALVKKSQKIMDETTGDFSQMAGEYMAMLDNAMEEARKLIGQDGQVTVDSIARRVMQIKASAGMFRYPLVSQVSDKMLQFIDSHSHLDKEMLLILEAYSNTLTYIVKNQIAEDPVQGKALIAELESAFGRYNEKIAQK